MAHALLSKIRSKTNLAFKTTSVCLSLCLMCDITFLLQILKGIAIPLGMRHLNTMLVHFISIYLFIVWNFFALTCAEHTNGEQETI